MEFIPIDHDPFAQNQPEASGLSFEPVDYDPFVQDEKKREASFEPVDYDPFSVGQTPQQDDVASQAANTGEAYNQETPAPSTRSANYVPYALNMAAGGLTEPFYAASKYVAGLAGADPKQFENPFFQAASGLRGQLPEAGTYPEVGLGEPGQKAPGGPIFFTDAEKQAYDAKRSADPTFDAQEKRRQSGEGILAESSALPDWVPGVGGKALYAYQRPVNDLVGDVAAGAGFMAGPITGAQKVAGEMTNYLVNAYGPSAVSSVSKFLPKYAAQIEANLGAAGTTGTVAESALRGGITGGLVGAMSGDPQKMADEAMTFATFDALAAGIGNAKNVMRAAGNTPADFANSEAFQAMTKNVIKEGGLPEKFYFDRASFDAFQQQGTMDPEARNLLSSLGLSGKERSRAWREGLTVEVPTEQIVTIMDKPWFASVKGLFRLQPSFENSTIPAGSPTYSFGAGVNAQSGNINPAYEPSVNSRELPGPTEADLNFGQAPTGGPHSGGGAVPAGYRLGSIVGKYESGGDYGLVSKGDQWGDPGGVSYGRYQLASQTGTVQAFLKFSGEQAPGPVNSPEFKAWWKDRSQDPTFNAKQDAFIQATHYEPVRQYVQAQFGIDANQNPMLAETLYAAGNGHGAKGAINVVSRALGGKDVASMTPEAVVDAIYAERLRPGENGGLAYWRSSPPKVQESLARRLASERGDVLALAGSSGAVSGTGGMADLSGPGVPDQPMGRVIKSGEALDLLAGRQKPSEQQAPAASDQPAAPLAQPPANPEEQALATLLNPTAREQIRQGQTFNLLTGTSAKPATGVDAPAGTASRPDQAIAMPAAGETAAPATGLGGQANTGSPQETSLPVMRQTPPNQMASAPPQLSSAPAQQPSLPPQAATVRAGQPLAAPGVTETQAPRYTEAELAALPVRELRAMATQAGVKLSVPVKKQDMARMILKAQTPAPSLDESAHQAATSPFNDIPHPTEAQKEAGNYPKGHVRIQGLDISVENPAGSVRSGIAPDGTPWETPMVHHYGYIKGTVGKDKDHLDVFMGSAAETSPRVFVVNQVDPATGKFDEHKVMLGFDSPEAAKSAYLANYEPGWRGLGSMASMGMADFKGWLKDGNTRIPAKEKTSSVDGARFARTDEPARNVVAQEIQQALAPALDRYPALSRITDIFQSESDLPGRLRREIEQAGVSGRFYAVFDPVSGRISFVADNIPSSKAAQVGFLEATLRHEGRHKGLSRVFGSEAMKRAWMRQAAASIPDDVAAWLKKNGMADTAGNRAEAAEEILVDWARTGKVHRLLDKLLAKIAEWVRSIFPKLKLTMAELRQMVARADGWMEGKSERPQFVDGLARPEPAFSRAEGYSVSDATMPRDARTFTEARAAAKDFVGKDMENETTGMVATVSNTNVSKMLSQSAVGKSISPAAQAHAVANLDQLFRIAGEPDTHPDRDGSPRIDAIHRFYAPMIHNGEVLVAKMTVKEFSGTKEGSKIYSVEAMEIEKAARNREASISPDEQERKSSPQAAFIEKIRALESQVKGEPEQVQPENEAGGAGMALQPPAASSGVESTPAPVYTPGRNENITTTDVEGNSQDVDGAGDSLAGKPRFMRAKDYEGSGPKAFKEAIPLGEKNETLGKRVSTPPEATRQGRGVGDDAMAPLDDGFRRSQIIKGLSEKLNTTLRVGEVRRPLAGTYAPRSGVARVAKANDVETAVHELFHAIQEKPLMALPKRMPAEVQALAYKGAKNLTQEGFAEFGRLYVTAPETLQEKAPGFLKTFEEALSKHPDLQKALSQAREAWNVWQQASDVQKVMSFIQRGEDQKGFTPPDLETIYTKVFDELHPIKKFSEALAERSGEKLPPSRDPFTLAVATRGWAGMAEHYLKMGTFQLSRASKYTPTGPSLRDILAPVQRAGKMSILDAYLLAKRAANDERVSGGFSGVMDKATFERVVDNVEGAHPDVVDAAWGLYAYSDELLRFVRESGVISADMERAILDRNAFYAPLYRVMDEGTPDGGLSKKFGKVPNPIKRLKGSSRDVFSPTENILRNTFSFINAAARNRVGEALIDAASKPGMGDFIEVLPLKTTSTKAGVRDILGKIQKRLEHAGSDTLADYANILGELSGHLDKIDEIEGLLRDKAKGEDVMERLTTLGLSEDDLAFVDDTLTLFSKDAWRTGPNETIFRKDGDPYRVLLSPQLYEAVASMNTVNHSRLVEILSLPASWLRAGATLAPEFGARNVMRDQIDAFTNAAGFSYIPYVTAFDGLFDILGGQEAYRKFYASGAAHAAMVSMDRAYLSKQMDLLVKAKSKTAMGILKSPIEALRALSEFSEEATRVGYFKKILTGDDMDAMLQTMAGTRELTLDFAKKGSSKGLQTWGKLTAFFNPALQGNLKSFENVFGKGRGKERWYYMLKSMMAITLPSLALWWYNKDDQDIDELPAWRKALFWNIAVHYDEKPMGMETWFLRPSVTGKGYVAIMSLPRPHINGVLFGGIPEAFMDWLAKDDVSSAKGLASAALGLLNPGTIPTFAGFPIEWWANKSLFFDRPIVPRGKEGNSPYLQYDSNTSDVMKLAGRGMSHIPGLDAMASPAKLESAVRSLTGNMGKHALNGSDFLLKRLGMVNAAPSPAAVASEIPILKAFFANSPGSSSKSVEKFYDIMETVTRMAADGKLEATESPETMKLIRKVTHAKSDAPPMVQQVNAAASALSLTRGLVYSIEENKQMSPGAKREQIDKLNVSIIKLSRNFVETWEKAHGKDWKDKLKK